MDKLKLSFFGESHGECVGMSLSGLPKGEKIDMASVQKLADMRKSGENAWSTARREPDNLEFTGGIDSGVTTGGPIVCEIKNTDVRKSDYEADKYIPRPSHADYAAAVKDKTGMRPSGGGRFSGRMTAPLTAAGGICREILKKRGIEICAYVAQIGGAKGKSYLNSDIPLNEAAKSFDLPLYALGGAAEMEKEIKGAKNDGDSVGGVIECIVYNLPVGLGDALLSGLEGKLSQLIFAIPAVKGVEFGSGFLLGAMRGSEANDPLRFDGGRVITLTNHNGGINGGISNGMPVTMRIAVKPTPSIMKEQQTVNLLTRENCTVKIKGRHDACIVPRAVAPVIAAVSLAVLDEILYCGDI